MTQQLEVFIVDLQTATGPKTNGLGTHEPSHLVLDVTHFFSNLVNKDMLIELKLLLNHTYQEQNPVVNHLIPAVIIFYQNPDCLDPDYLY